MNYPDSVQYLYALGNEMRSARLGLERMVTVLEAMGNPHRACQFVHVAGTNGKGSTAAMIESGLRATGVLTGLFTSPHLIEPTERIRIAGRNVSAEQFAAAFDLVHKAAGHLLARQAIDIHPSYFETVTAMAFLIFATSGVEIAVMEVGLGGRLDATNVLHPKLAVITPIDYDHQAWLGNTLELIAGEKAGILKPGVPAVFAPQLPEAAQVLERHAPHKYSSEWKIENLHTHARGSRFTTQRGEQGIEIECPLAGEHQVDNALTSVAALVELGVRAGAIQRGIAATEWQGRLQRISGQPEIIVDGAHNPAGARALAAYIERFYKDRRVRLIYGAMSDKAVAEMAGVLFPLADEIILTRPENPRSMDPARISELGGHPHMRVTENLAEALDCVKDAVAQDAIFITGSLYLVGEALNRNAI